MTTLDRPSVPAIRGTLGPVRRLRMVCSVLRCAPRYRRLRAYVFLSNTPALRHARLRAPLVCRLNAVRTHSSWSRA